MNQRTVLLPLLVCVCGGAYAAASAAAPASQDPLHRESPRSSVYSFLETCRAKNYSQAARYIDLRKAPADERTAYGSQLAQQLEQILDRDVRFDVASLSGDPDGSAPNGASPRRERVDSFQWNGRTVELDLERVTLKSGVSVWVFAADSVSLIPELAKLTTDTPIERHLPGPLVEWKWLETPVWRWLALALLAIVLGPISKLIARPALFLTESIASRITPNVNKRALAAFVTPLRWLLYIALFRAGIEAIGPGALLRIYLERGLALLFFVAMAQLAMATADIFVWRVRTVLEARHRSFSYSAIPLASRFLKIIIVLLTIAAVLSAWGYNTTTILAGLGVGGLAIALAAQKTVENLFGGVAVITDRPVAVGDFCRFGNQVGTVEDIGLRSTRIRTLDRTIVTIPNAEFSTMTLENFSKRDKMWFHITLNLRRDTLPGQVRSVLESVARMLQQHAKVQIGSLPVRFIGVGTYSLDIEVFAYVLTADSDEFLQIQQELLLLILDAVQAAGTALAIPTQAYLPLGGIAPLQNGESTPSIGERSHINAYT